MKTATCKAGFITLQDGSTLLSPQYCKGSDCRTYPCPRVKKWAKRHDVLDAVKAERSMGA